METGQQFPEDVKSLLNSLIDGERIIYSVLGDIDEHGNFGERWLLLTTKRVIILNPSTRSVSQFP